MFDDDDLLGLFLDIFGSWIGYIGHVFKNYFLVFIGIVLSIIGYSMWSSPQYNHNINHRIFHELKL